MAYTYEELKGKTVAELREIARQTGHEAVQGASQMHKEHLLPVLCQVLGIDTHGHRQVVGIDKGALKAKMRALRKQREAALEARDVEQLKNVRRQIHHLNHRIRAHAR